MIELQNVSKTYQVGELRVPVLKNIHLVVKKGEYVSIMGPSGSGKSTLMNIIGCLDLPTEGIYRLNGKDVSEEDEIGLAAIRNQTIGFIFQHFHLLPRMNAQQNVELPLVYQGLSRKEREKKAREALKRVGLEDRRHHRPNELSGGQQQRVAIARSIVTEPFVLLADEPTGALDSAASENILDLFAELHQEGRTIVVITHDPEVAARADRRILLRDGEIVKDLSSSEVRGGQ